jgi:hypothetical protein
LQVLIKPSLPFRNKRSVHFQPILMEITD